MTHPITRPLSWYAPNPADEDEEYWDDQERRRQAEEDRDDLRLEKRRGN